MKTTIEKEKQQTILQHVFFCECKELGKGIGQFLQRVKVN